MGVISSQPPLLPAGPNFLVSRSDQRPSYHRELAYRTRRTGIRVQRTPRLREHVGMKKQRNADITPAEKDTILGEKERVEKRGRIRQFVFGSMDGLLVPLGVVSGVAGGTGSTKAVVIAGIAEAFAGALSMGAGNSCRAEPRLRFSRRRYEKRTRASETIRSTNSKRWPSCWNMRE
jgi:hypothetical protein